ncbi:MAG: hypothetical protein IPM18_09185 [Phycisphaerales bacterium]|nr:hypothetical protein [Phycisphaerales bacterium]
MNTAPSPARSLLARLLHGVGVAVGLVAAFLLGMILSAAGVDRQSPLLIAAGLIVSLAALIYGLRIVARWQRRSDAEAAAFANHLVCSECGVFPHDKGIACAPSRARAAVNVAVGIVVALVLLNVVMSGLDRRSLGAGFAVVLLGTAVGRWTKAPRFACPTCKGNSVVSRNSRKGVRWAAQSDERSVERSSLDMPSSGPSATRS